MKLNELLLVAQKKEKECLSLLLRDSLVDMAYCSIGHMLVCPGREALQKTKNAIVQQAVQHYYPRWVCVLLLSAEATPGCAALPGVSRSFLSAMLGTAEARRFMAALRTMESLALSCGDI